ncbi:flagellar basal-body MS-ring/collar protein FliF [Endozoicomonas lisbonensis]|uniref:Flagellar M-ring protein n=1 Tax=Endozoicomonas lisbonensis TaxID=3120522 RepID=A0ABV2SBL4_9GAMM
MSASAKMDPAAAMQRMRDGVSYFSSRAGKDFPGIIRKHPAAVAVGASLLLSLVIVTGLWLSSGNESDNWRPLYGRQELYDVAAVVEALDAGQMDYRLHPTSGQIMVAADELNTARMQLATAGIKPAASAGMELLTSGGQLGRSQFVERKQYLKGLEGELEQTIASLRPVRTARVHLAVPERTAFLREQVEPSASVYLDLYPGIRMEGRQVQGIINLLSGSFPDLKPERIHVLDQNSNPLTTNENTPSQTDKQMQYRRTIEQQYVQRLTQLLEPVVGKDNLRVAVNADIDFSYQEHSREGFDPETSVLRSESYSGSSNPKGASGVPGASSNVDNLNEEVETPEGSESSVSTIRNYEVDRTLSFQRQEAFRIARINASVILNSRIDGVDAELTLSAVDDLVRNAVGVDLDRGDRISVRSLPFFDEAVAEEVQISSVAMAVREGGSMMPVMIGLLALALVGVIAAAIFYSVRQRRQRHEQAALAAELALLDAGAGNEDSDDDDAFSKVDATASDRVRDLAVSSPDQIATILERWIKEAD